MSTARTVSYLVAILGFVVSASLSRADSLLPGLELSIKLPKQDLSFKVVDKLIDTGTFGSTGDPRCEAAGGGGASLRVNGGPGNDITIELPCAGWRSPNGSATNTFNTNYVYKDKTGATCGLVNVKHGRNIQVRCRGPQVAYTLGAAQGNVDVTLRLGSAQLLTCTTFGPPPTKVLHDGSNGTRYLAKHSPAPLSCTSP
jgi:hypothetical protein